MKRALGSFFFVPVLFSLPILLLSSAGCHQDGDGISQNDATINLRGQAFFPPQLTSGKVAVANAPFQVLDFEKSAATQDVADGTTDADGTYDVTITQSKAVAVIISGSVRVSGLISADARQIGKDDVIGKDFDGITDIACEAGVTAIVDGSIEPEKFSNERIANLEAAAAVVDAGGSVNHLDPASVTAAAQQVRQLTDDGDHPPA